MAELLRSSHCIGESNYHLQFTPAYRRRIFERRVVRDLVLNYLMKKAKELGVMVCAVEFGPDHVHLFLSNCKNYATSDLVRHLKGYVSHEMRKAHWNLFKDLLWGKKFWSEGYFYRSVGAITAKSCEYYVKHAQAKHWRALDYECYKHNTQKTLTHVT